MKNLVSKKIDGPGYVIVVHSPKGGCGKSTTSANLVATLISNGYSVQAIDLDQQGNFKSACNSYFQNYMQDGYGRLKVKHDPIINSEESYNKMSLNLRRSISEPKAGRNTGDELMQVRVPLALLSEIEYLREENDFIVIDTPGIENPFLTQLILLANLTVVPVLPSNYDILALSRLVSSLVNTANTLGVNPASIPIISMINICDKRDPMVKQIREALNMTGLPCTETVVPQRQQYRRMTFTGVLGDMSDAGKPYFVGPKRAVAPCVEDQESLINEIFYYLEHGVLPELSKEEENTDNELTHQEAVAGE